MQAKDVLMENRDGFSAVTNGFHNRKTSDLKKM